MREMRAKDDCRFGSGARLVFRPAANPLPYNMRRFPRRLGLEGAPSMVGVTTRISGAVAAAYGTIWRRVDRTPGLVDEIGIAHRP